MKSVNESVSKYKNLKYHYEKSSNGDIIIPINNNFVYTDTNADSLGISKILSLILKQIKLKEFGLKKWMFQTLTKRDKYSDGKITPEEYLA